MYFKDKKLYYGNWVNGKLNGFGFYETPQKIYKGMWVKSRK